MVQRGQNYKTNFLIQEEAERYQKSKTTVGKIEEQKEED